MDPVTVVNLGEILIYIWRDLGLDVLGIQRIRSIERGGRGSIKITETDGLTQRG